MEISDIQKYVDVADSVDKCLHPIGQYFVVTLVDRAAHFEADGLVGALFELLNHSAAA